jgi:hypothetical protein
MGVKLLALRVSTRYFAEGDHVDDVLFGRHGMKISMTGKSWFWIKAFLVP